MPGCHAGRPAVSIICTYRSQVLVGYKLGLTDAGQGNRVLLTIKAHRAMMSGYMLHR